MLPIILMLSLASQPAEFNIPAPEFGKATEWLNSKPMKLADLKGKVVVVQFFAFNCINCQHNYPWYKEVQNKYSDSEVVLIGIHTPELQSEYNVATLKKKLADAGLKHPILVDNDHTNWKLYDNAIWPCIYLIDKKGNARYRWDGELEWQSSGGGKIMHEKIKQLQAEK